jgi:kumamolisin
VSIESRVPLSGSERQPPPGARRLGPDDPVEPVTVTVIVRRRPGARPLDPAAAPLERDVFAEERGADDDDLAAVERFARDHGLAVVETSPERRTVKLSGSVADVSEAFGVELHRYDHPARGSFRGRTGPVYLPADLTGVVEGVFGLDDRPQLRSQFRIADPRAVTASYTPIEVAQAYGFPTGANGAGQTVAIVELGGGYRRSDLDTYFGDLGLPVPTVIAISVDGATNSPAGGAGSADGEVLLDIEVVGAIAPAARLAIYFAPNSDQGFIDALTTAVHDRANAPSVVSISWGGPESTWTVQAQTALDQAFADAVALGVTVCVACGDNGSGDGVGDGRAHADFPASSPHVLACGGTRLDPGGAETVWNDGVRGGATGGGVSDTFDLPDWQSSAGVPVSANPGGRVGRGVPDVSGDADPQTGYSVLVDGQRATFGGTSAVAPLWAGLVALLNEKRGTRVGFLNGVLYGSGNGALRDVTSGNNDLGDAPAYSAGPGWDACTGLGSPDGAALSQLLAPGTPTGATGSAA